MNVKLGNSQHRILKIMRADFKLEDLLEKKIVINYRIIKFVKYISRLGKKACNIAVLSELVSIKVLVLICVNKCSVC